ncbi:MAG: membrane protein insertase YidC [Sphaerochaetaceae bacterium]|nr:membrane protein insertase YidC [Sphaerochaetaceae bacterium]
MDRNTILAIILTVIVITVGMSVQTMFFPSEQQAFQTKEGETAETVEVPAVSSVNTDSLNIIAVGSNSDAKPFVVENEVMVVTLDPKGASVDSIVLKEHKDGKTGKEVDLFLKDSSDSNALMMYADSTGEKAIDAVFDYTISETDKLTVVKFSKEFESNGKKFEIVRQYAFSKGSEYLFQTSVTFNSLDGSALPMDHYTIGVEPQVGPTFQTLNGNYDYRRAYYSLDGKNSKKNVNLKKDYFLLENNVDWVSTAGKYFSVVLVPQDGANYSTYFAQNTDDATVSQINSFFMTRKGLSGSSITDVYSVYGGPRISETLNRYDLANDNVFGLSNLHLNKTMDTSSWFGWLETILKFVLNFFYKFIPNYGVAIILLTLLIKLLVHPLTKKSMDSTAKMSALGPKTKELQEKYKDDPQQLNIAMSKLYKEEGINPMGSCLPMLIQFPVLLAMYGLLNNHFELRGAMFIPGWITDLSVPETIFTLPFYIPLIGNQIHLLPILYTASMIFSMKITQSGQPSQPGQESTMKFMTYGMPIIFFFVLYNAPSGLLLYWSVMNVLSVGQQIFVNNKKKAEIKANKADGSNTIKFKKNK